MTNHTHAAIAIIGKPMNSATVPSAIAEIVNAKRTAASEINMAKVMAAQAIKNSKIPLSNTPEICVE